MNNKTRLNRIKTKAKPNKGVAVFFFDDEKEYLYTAPYYEKGARQVTMDEVNQAQKTKTVILVEYMEGMVSEPDEGE